MDERRRQSGLGFGTRALRAATKTPRVDQQPDAVPIYQSVTFSAETAAELAEVLGDQRPGYAYSRIDNPTSVALAAAVAEIEGAETGYVFASGMAAIHATFVSLLRQGDHVVAARQIYGSVQHLLDKILSRWGIDTTFVDATDPAAIEAAFRPNTRLLHVETLANPTIVVADLAVLIELAHGRGIIVSVDNTFASPWLCRPAELGADLVIEALTKWIGGHSDVLAGSVVGRKELIDDIRQVQIDTGGTLSPQSAFLVLRGIETLHVRMERHSSNALALARHLEASGVAPVHYPGLPSHPQFAVAQRQLRAGGGMLAFELADRHAAEALLDGLTLPPRTASLGSVRTIAVHPPSTTHRQLDAAALAAIGIPEGLVRVSVGLEEIDDLIADFDSALAAARAPVATSATASAPASA
ncbi:MAG: aminotransferase class I/II-fold pyridoxal phosphate-dependent enzyme [Chloroflexota bacterium]